MILPMIAISAVAVTGCASGSTGDAAATSPEPQPTQSASTKDEEPDKAPASIKTEEADQTAEHSPETTVPAGKGEAHFGEALLFPNKIAVTVEFVKYFKISDAGFAVGAEPGDDAGLFKVSLHNGSKADFDGSVAGVSTINYGDGATAEIVFDEAAGAEAASFGTIKPGETAELLDGRLLPRSKDEVTVKVFGDSPGTDEPLSIGTIVDRP